ncbi:MAG: hypothetical protein ABSB35_10820 [Bryobacteraceae bacterium]|jgi:hypothetical protein
MSIILDLLRRLLALRPEVELTSEEQAHVSAEWEQGLDEWLDSFSQRLSP